MARYIDADKFIKELEQEKTEAIEFEDGVAVYEIEHMMNLIGMQPTVDVVPKSEVEEIFEEIEKILSKSRERYTVGGYHYDHYKRDSAFVEAFAELKEKYVVEIPIVRDLAEEAINRDVQAHLEK